MIIESIVTFRVQTTVNSQNYGPGLERQTDDDHEYGLQTKSPVDSLSLATSQKLLKDMHVPNTVHRCRR
nr:hypothetical protein CFP56_57850 [Quercus suber]